MKVGEVCFLTNDVVKLADFYKFLLGIEDDCNDSVHQTILSDETMLTIYNDGTIKNNQNRNICIAFTVKDVDFEYKRLQEKGIPVLEKPRSHPWGARNMCFLDPDGNRVYLRSFE